MTESVCKKCGSKEHKKYGFVRGLQRYKCKECGYNYTLTKLRGVDPRLKAFSVVLYGMCGVSMNKIAKLFKVSNVAVLKWIRKEANLIEDPKPHAESNIVMIDEMWHFVNGKKRKLGFGEPLMGYRVELLDGNWAIVVIPALKS